jgi:hypothetical protein
MGESEQEFLREQAEFEAAFHATGDPQVLWHALLHAWSSRQIPTAWLVWGIGAALNEQRTDAAARRYREQARHVQRFVVVHDLRSNGYTKEDALDAAVEILAAQRAAAARVTIEDSYDLVRKDLDRPRSESEFFYFVELLPKASALAPRADSTLYTADSAIWTADGALPWFQRTTKR